MNKLIALVLCLIAVTASCSAFVIQPSLQRTATALSSGFLDGKGRKITVRDDEDDAMWMPEEAPAKKAAAPKKKAAAKKSPPKRGAVAKKAAPKAAAFKFPWDK